METKKRIELNINCIITDFIIHKVNIHLLVIENNSITMFYTTTPHFAKEGFNEYYPHLEEYKMDNLKQIKNDFNEYIYNSIYNIILQSNRKDKIAKSEF